MNPLITHVVTTALMLPTMLLPTSTESVGGAPAATAALDWRCTGSSHSTNPPFGNPLTHWLIGARTNGSGGPISINRTRRYWLSEENLSTPQGTKPFFLSTGFATCDYIQSTQSVTMLTPQPAGQQPSCTAPGDYIQVEGGQVFAYRLIGQRTSTTQGGPASTYRFWHKEKQGSPGLWAFQSAGVARCPS
ncbi:hypothetical protein AB0K48_40570 [Nonomuraea sp. NPDC055795]